MIAVHRARELSWQATQPNWATGDWLNPDRWWSKSKVFGQAYELCHGTVVISWVQQTPESRGSLPGTPSPSVEHAGAIADLRVQTGGYKVVAVIVHEAASRDPDEPGTGDSAETTAEEEKAGCSCAHIEPHRVSRGTDQPSSPPARRRDCRALLTPSPLSSRWAELSSAVGPPQLRRPYAQQLQQTAGVYTQVIEEGTARCNPTVCISRPQVVL